MIDRKEAEDVAMKLPFHTKFGMCKCCEQYDYCTQICNSKCGILIQEVMETLQKEELQQTVNVIEFPVDMDNMQKNILVGLLNSRKECTDGNMLSARGMVNIIDALFYLVQSVPYVGNDFTGGPER